MSVSESYCILPFIHLAISNEGSVRPCCISNDSLREGSGGRLLVSKQSLNEIWSSKALKTLRGDLLRGEKPANCERCWSEERLGIESKRQRDNEVWKRYYGMLEPAPSPLWVDLKLGNLCNLKCRICNPTSSSKFASEAAQIYGNVDLAEIQDSVSWSSDPNSSFWKGMDDWLSRIEYFDIYGGEPFLSQPHFQLLERSVQRGCAKKQTVHYNTNATIFPEKAVKDIWPHFKLVKVMFSIDGVEKQFEYQRYPADWQKVEENIRRFKSYKYLNLDICYTVNAMNIWSFPEFYEWTQKIGLRFWINYLYDPEPFRAQIFSNSAKKQIEARLQKLSKYTEDFKSQIQPMINFMWDQNYDEDQRQKFLQQIAVYDLHRKQKFSDVFPETVELIQAR